MSKPRFTREERIQQAKAVHGNKYDYSLWEEGITSTSRVKNICLIHGSFEQKLAYHINNKNGCPKCNNKYKDLDERKEAFIQKAINLHGAIFDYSKANYQTDRYKVEIFCRICNKYFWQSPNNHLAGNGCKKCGIISRTNKRRSTKNDFINKARAIHLDLYDYSEVDYINNRQKVKIFCLCCNQYFWQIPNSHLMGNGCSLCNIRGKRLSNDLMIVYLISFVNQNKKYIGITSQTFYKRWRNHKNIALRGHFSPLSQAIRQAYANKEDIKWELLETVEAQYASKKESHYIELYNTRYPEGLNIGNAGAGLRITSS